MNLGKTLIEIINFGRKLVNVLDRTSTPLSKRENLLERLKSKPSILEIGPFCNPAIIGPQVKYFEVLDQLALVARAKELNYKIENVPEVHFLSPTGNLAVIDEMFDCCFSSHVIEHQPDLVTHLQQVEQILEPDGEYCLIVPDQRYCFDHYLRPSTIADILDAYYSGRKLHGLKSIIEHFALTTHNDPVRHWRRDHSQLENLDYKIARIKNAIQIHEQANGCYVDVHAWQFTPKNFYEVLTLLNSLNLTNLTPVEVFDTPRGRFEFTAILKKRAASVLP
jgi:SAM-dependent methyltransferase